MTTIIEHHDNLPIHDDPAELEDITCCCTFKNHNHGGYCRILQYKDKSWLIEDGEGGSVSFSSKDIERVIKKINLLDR